MAADSDTTEYCPKCGKPVAEQKSGSLTQWMRSCACNSAVSAEIPEPEVTLCSRCGKRISEGRPGSITQFVFRSDTCSCARPMPVSTRSERLEMEAFETDADGEGESEIELDPASFPTDRYKAVRILGTGASGTVYMAIDELLKKRVAVKTLHSLDGDELVYFQNEARAISKLEHPNIIRILDFGGTDDGVPYMVLDHVAGVSIESYLEESGPLDPELAIDIFSQVCRALEHAHRNEIFHRDLKPSNILISGTEDDIKVFLIDFGVAAVKHANQEPTIVQGRTIVGTPGYMSPDQVKGYKFDARSEIYSLGCVMFEALTGKRPYEGESALDVISRHANEPVPRLSQHLSGDSAQQLEDLILRCMAKEADERFQSIDQVEAALIALKQTTEEPEQFESREPDSGLDADQKDRSSILLLTAIAILLVGSVGIIYFTVFRRVGTVDSNVYKVSSADIGGDGFTFNWSRQVDTDGRILYSHFGELDSVDARSLPEDAEYVRIVSPSMVEVEAIRIIARRRKLRKLEFSVGSVSAEVMKAMADCVLESGNLISLGIINCVDESRLSEVTRLKSLRHMTIEGNTFVDQDFPKLRRLPLTRLEFRFTLVTDAGLLELGKWPSLKKLVSHRNFRISQKAFKEFRKINPQCEVIVIKPNR